MIIQYRKLYRTIDCLDKLFGVLLKIFILPIALIAVYGIYDFFLTESEAEKSGQLAKEFVEEAKNAEDVEIDFGLLKQKNSEIVAWLRIPDTKIDFPIMHARDNKFYLSHDFEKKFAITGGVFLDYRNSGDFSDDFSIIYGHRMSSGRMFSDIGKFSDRNFFDVHPKALLYTPEKLYVLDIVAFASIEGDDGVVYGFRNYTKEETVQRIFDKASNRRNENGGGRYILLSTCSTERQTGRDVVLGVVEE